MLILDVTVVNLALPAIGAGLHLDRATLTWALTTYTLVFGGLMLLGGRLADLLGARRVMLTGLAVFTGASLVSGLATNAALLIGGRVAQGAGAALLSPAALAPGHHHLHQRRAREGAGELGCDRRRRGSCRSARRRGADLGRWLEVDLLH